MTGDYALGFSPAAQRQITRILVGSRLRQWREERIVQINQDLKDDPMGLGESRESPSVRLWFCGGLAVYYEVDESARRVTVLGVRLTR